MKNSSIMDVIKHLQDEVKRGKSDCQSEATDLFKKIFIAIDAQAEIPLKGLDDLAVEFSDLEASLWTITKERDDLLDTVKNLRVELKILSDKLLPKMEPIPLSSMSDDDRVKHGMGIEIKEVKQLKDATSKATGNGSKRPRSRKRGDEKGKKQKQQIEIALKDSLSSDDYEANAVEDGYERNIEYVVSGREASQTKNLIHDLIKKGNDDSKIDVTQDCEYEATAEPDPELQDASNNFNCDLCSWSTPQKHRLKQHVIEAHAHAEIKSHQCQECDYSTARRDRLERHWDSVHNQGDKKYKCEECPYSTAEKSKLQRHWDSVHNQGDKKFKCGRCPYSSADKFKLQRHMDKIHA